MHRRLRQWSSTSGLHAPILITRGWRDTGILSARATTGTLVTGLLRAITSIVTTKITGGTAGITMNGTGTAMSTAGVTDTITDTITNPQSPHTRCWTRLFQSVTYFRRKWVAR